MGEALGAITDVGMYLRVAPGASLVLAGLAILLWLGSTVLASIPFVGVLVTIGSIFLVGAMYGVADAARPSLAPGIAAIRARWLSIFGVYLVTVVALLAVAVLTWGPFGFLLVIGLLTGEFTVLAIGSAILGAIASVLWFVIVMHVQLLLPAIVVDRIGATEALSRAYGIVVASPLSVVGATVTRLVLQYVPPLLAAGVSLAIGWDAWWEVVETFEGAVFEAPGQPVSLPGIVLETVDPSLLAITALLLLVGGVIGEVLRVIYLSAYYGRVRDGFAYTPRSTLTT